MSFLIKVIWNGEEIIYRDLKAGRENSLLELHQAILDAFKLSADQMAGFTKIDEVHQVEVDYQLEAFDENSSLMADVRLEEVFAEEGDVLDYTYDFLNEIGFSIELMEILKEEVQKISLEKSHGNIAEELLKASDSNDAESILIQAMLNEAGLDDDEYGDEDLFGNEDFESLDDYEGLY